MPEGQVHKDLSIISDEVTNCKEIVQGLLDLARPAKLKRRELNVGILVDDVVERLNTSQASNAEINVQHSEQSITAFLDEAAIKQVLNNLLRNAAEAAGTDGQIDIAVVRDESVARIAISDSGAGIDDDFRDELFKPFRTTKDKGTGLGLAISLSIVRHHGGSIDVDKGPMGGARFTVVVPLNMST